MLGNGKVAVITGGTKGIGKAIALGLKKNKCKVAATYFHDEKAAIDFNKETGINIYRWNVADFAACDYGIQEIEKDLGGHVSILVNNAGITRDSFMHKMEFKQWEEVIENNLTSCFNMCHAVIDNMRVNKFGRIINISSINGLKGQIGQVNYSAAKAGIIGLTKALALEGARNNITVNAIAPGYIDTDMIQKIEEKIRDSIKAQIPVGRFGLPSDIARTVLFLADEEAGFITGETISVNGGQFMD